MLFVQLGLNIVLSGQMKYMFSLIRALQMILFLPLHMISIPANVSMVFQIIFPIALFDIFETYNPVSSIFEFDLVSQELNVQKYMRSQVQQLGYGSFNSLDVMGSVTIFCAFYLFRVCLVPFLALVSSKFKPLKRWFRALQRRLFFRDIHILLLEAYIEFVIAFYFNMKYPLYTSAGEMMGVIFGYMCLFGTMIFLPLSFLYLSSKSRSIVSSPGFRGRWGGLYEGVSLRSRMQLMFFLFYMVRRTFFVTVAVNLGWFVALQIQLTMLANTLTLIYQGSYCPLESRFQNRVELFNEFIVDLCTIYCCAFTSWVPSREAQSLYGY